MIHCSRGWNRLEVYFRQVSGNHSIQDQLKSRECHLSINLIIIIFRAATKSWRRNQVAGINRIGSKVHLRMSVLPKIVESGSRTISSYAKAKIPVSNQFNLWMNLRYNYRKRYFQALMEGSRSLSKLMLFAQVRLAQIIIMDFSRMEFKFWVVRNNASVLEGSTGNQLRRYLYPIEFGNSECIQIVSSWNTKQTIAVPRRLFLFFILSRYLRSSIHLGCRE